MNNSKKKVIDGLKSTRTYIKWLKKEIKDLSKTRKYYTLQSEYHRMMYAKTLELETIQATLAKFNQNDKA